MITADIHTHICRSSFDEMLQGAAQKGLQYFGISEHTYQLAETRWDEFDFFMEGDVYTYAAYARFFQKAGPQPFTLLKGLELDLLPGYTQKAWAVAQRENPDYVIASLHEIDGWDIHTPRAFTQSEAHEVWRRCLAAQLQEMQALPCQVLGHPTRMAVTVAQYPPDMPQLLAQLAQCVKEHGAAVEINARDLTICRPLLQMLAEACARQGTDVAVGSDAHAPQDIAAHFAQLEELLKAAGIVSYTVFQNREKVRLPL